MRVLVLGAGQDVGRSCVVVRLGGRTLMFDCGMHMGHNDARRFPDFSLLAPDGDYNSVVDAVFITHFHLDHVGALPFFTGVCGYTGPVFMTHPTRAIAPVLLQDYHKLLVTKPGSGPLFALHHIDAAMANVRLMDLQETVQVCEGVEATAYYAGHTLGAAMIHVRVGCESLVYTGDFNTVPERHLAGACIERLHPDLLITESTYAASMRSDRRARETGLLTKIHRTVSAGGKVLIPVSAVGRAQELLMLLHEHWERTQLEVPIYMSSAMAARANTYYKLLQNWASERVKGATPGARSSAFGFSRVQDWQREHLDGQGACVLFATPGMLQGGLSLEVFKAWAPDRRNLVVLPSYQVAGTVGFKLSQGLTRGLHIDKTTLDVNCQVEYGGLSAHSNAKGILTVVQQLSPAAVMLVHGAPDEMAFMQSKIARDLHIPCFMPANGEEVHVASGGYHAVPVSAQLLRRLPQLVQAGDGASTAVAEAAAGWLQVGDVGQLAGAAMQLAGLDPQVQGQQQQQQQQQEQLLQMHGTPASVRAAQLAPWLEVLASTAQQVNQEQQQEGHPDSSVPTTREPPPLEALSRELQQQLDLEQQAVVVDGMLLVHHPPAQPGGSSRSGGGQPVMHLLPMEDAAASLQMEQHSLRLSCRLRLSPAAWVKQEEGQASSAADDDKRQASAAAAAVADVLRLGLAAPLAQLVRVDSTISGAVVVQLRSVSLRPDAESSLACSWLLPDDALAQQCVSLLEQRLQQEEGGAGGGA